ncbi:methyltransferase domain-containing protein [Zavarzinia compransoris]|uniref:Methyltransferase type 11 n=1 Tax=Zavarzinia compransoris TaxID=1264899 RepID=A0A317DW32_9PROT|nr:methyltransferase domain-containing protein [Zavarzinia compransoris]PWR18927.1 methyltransferase type 11 [Zavarzinia compransoris]TDP48923.1 methyltransferase family protein [Zavarzinia compransoris]
MRLDVTEFRAFYDSPLGAVTRRLLRRRLREMWPDLHGLTLLGLGYATPFLRPFRDSETRVIALMPGPQGVTRWPRRGPAAVALSEETLLPLADGSVDRILLLHELELATDLRPLLREIWRVLAPEGRILAVVPNRRGIWARLDITPFGAGQPFSLGQIEQTLRGAMFEPRRSLPALYLPPTRRRFLLRTAPFWERLGSRWSKGFAGVWLVEASKSLYALTPPGERASARIPLKNKVLVPSARRSDPASETARRGG